MAPKHQEFCNHWEEGTFEPIHSPSEIPWGRFVLYPLLIFLVIAGGLAIYRSLALVSLPVDVPNPDHGYCLDHQ
jgi:hypothetical protein